MKKDQTDKSITEATIYLRVSSQKQVTEGHGLKSQETRCREFAERNGWVVVQVFSDTISGGAWERPGMTAMLKFLKRGKKRVVIIDDISRLARDMFVHLKFRLDIRNAGGVLKSPSHQFGEDSSSVLLENLLASMSQHHRQKNGEQVHDRMRARILNGYWPFRAPVGYKYERRRGFGKVLVRDEPVATVVQEALPRLRHGAI